MCKASFNKPALSLEKQILLLRERGLDISCDKATMDFLLHNNYYRLEGYWFEYYKTSRYPEHEFCQETKFSDVLSNYQGDKLLRMATFEMIEIIEVSIRSVFAYVLATEIGPFPYEQCNFTCSYNHYADFIKRLIEDTKHSKDMFIIEFHKHYKDPIPPIWIMVEIMTMGEISKWYGDYLPKPIQSKIASVYGITPIVLTSWLHSLSIIRNRCAHHNRIYGKYQEVSRYQRN